MYRRRSKVNWPMAVLTAITAALSLPFMAFVVVANLS